MSDAFFTKDLMTGPRFSIGDYSYGRIEVVGSVGRVTVGRFCSIAEDVQAIMVGHNPDWITTYPFPALADRWPEAQGIEGHPKPMGDLVIGHDVWIGQRALLMGGISIGHGAIIGAGAVVTRDVAPYAVAVGAPAATTRMRFSEEKIDRLLRLAWWDWPEDKIRRNVDRLCSGDVDALEGAE